MLKKLLQSWLKQSLPADLDIDSPNATVYKRRTIQSKSFLKCFYEDCYQFICGQIPTGDDGVVLEIGSGAGFFKDSYPGLVTSEILNLSTVDVILDAQTLPLRRNCLRSIVMVDVFHHLPDVKTFLKEALICVRPGGTIVMVEPWITRWSHFIYRFFHHEPLDMNTADWSFPANGPLAGANSALPSMFFERDRRKFESEFPEWGVEEIKLDYPFAYLVSGGLSYRSLLPGNMFGFFRRLENAFQPVMGTIAMFAKITLRHRQTLN
jgi:SAM-dependent methyltransferase